MHFTTIIDYINHKKQNNEYNDDNKDYEIIKYFNNIYVLPCLHEIKSKANRLVKFNNKIMHTCVSQTDVADRLVLNMGYI